MSCTNCFNGCTDIKSDQCVKYTGIDIVSLGIENGDPLSTVLTQLSTYLVDAMDGSGITPDVDDTCALIAGYLGAGTTLNDFISALIQAACSLQTQVTAVAADITTLNADYDVDCLAGVVDADDTHDVLQAVIVKLCSMDDTLTALAVTLSTNYVALADLNSLISTYLSTTSLATLMSSRMIPYAAVPFFGSDSYMVGKFDGTGAGIGVWANIYLCNGRNGTPDMRGRVPVCATSGMNGLGYNSAVDPGVLGNPSYSLNTVAGANNVALSSVNQIPSHTHIATVNITDPTHTHYTAAAGSVNINPLSSTTPIKTLAGGISYPSSGNYALQGVSGTANVGLTSAKSTGLTNANVLVTNSYVGGSIPTTTHENRQPVIAAYYIIYIP